MVADYSKVWNEQFVYEQGSVAHYYKVRDDFNRGDQSPANMLYLLARCVKGSVRYGSNGLFNQSPDKRRNGTSPKTLKSNVDAISYYLKGRTEFLSQDYREVLELTRPGDVVYMDPPYQGVSNVRDSRYFSGVEFDDFVEAIDRLNRRGVDFLISYDGNGTGLTESASQGRTLESKHSVRQERGYLRGSVYQSWTAKQCSETSGS